MAYIVRTTNNARRQLMFTGADRHSVVVPLDVDVEISDADAESLELQSLQLGELVTVRKAAEAAEAPTKKSK